MTAIISLKSATVVVNNGLDAQQTILDHVDLDIYERDFITVLGGNGAGKSTLFNVIAGTLPLTSGKIFIKDQDATKWPAQKRAKYLARVFQDPKMGTAPRMTVAENLLIALYRGQTRYLIPRQLDSHKPNFLKLITQTGNGLEKHLDTPTGLLSGGQRQALSLLMATIKRPDLLLLDEHTAALDPKTSQSLMTLTQQFVEEDQLTTLMITHQLEDAMIYGNRLLVMKNGQIIKDLRDDDKKQLSMTDYLALFD